MKITIIRHGETDWNLQRRAQGSVDTELNQTGLNQAKNLSLRLANEPCDIIYSSDLQRASKTAEIINEQHHATFITSSCLRESSLGEFEGKYFDTAESREAFHHYMSQRAPAYFAQVQGYLKETILSSGKEHIFIVGHFGTLQAIICYFMNIPVNERSLFPVGNTGLYQFLRNDNGSFRMIREND